MMTMKCGRLGSVIESARRTIRCQNTCASAEMEKVEPAQTADYCWINWRCSETDANYMTYPAPSFTPNRKICIVPLSLHTHISLSSLLKATPYMIARSAPRRNSLVRFPVCVSHIRTSVPRVEVEAKNRPDGGTVKVVSALSCAIIISLGCVV